MYLLLIHISFVACDVSIEFKDLKAGVKAVQKRGQDSTNEILIARLRSYLKNWLVEMKRI